MNPLHIYTDGGCTGNPGPGGWAAVILQDTNLSTPPIELSGGEQATTNNRMELSAVIQALNHITTHFPNTTELVITTDSSYVKNGMHSWLQNWKRKNWKTASGKPVKNRDLWQTLDTLTRPFTISWQWVKAHDGNIWNEHCDTMVRKERQRHS